MIQDDIIDTAGTITKAAAALKANGADKIFACAVHGVLSGPAIDRIEKSPIDKMIVTNTIPLTGDKAKCEKIKVLSVARLLGRRLRAFTRRLRCPRCSCKAESKGQRAVMEAVLEAVARESRGKNEARRTRAAGRVPAVVYGGVGGEAIAISVEPKALRKILLSESGANTLISLKLAGTGDTRVLVKEYQLDPVTHQILHADFYRIAMDKVLHITVSVTVEGRSARRQAAGRHPRVRPSPGRRRVPAGGHSRAHRDQRRRADAAPGRARARHLRRTQR